MEQERVLSGTDAWHVVVLTESRQVLVQFLDTLLVSLDAFAHQLFFELFVLSAYYPVALCRSRTYTLASGFFMTAFVLCLAIIRHESFFLVLFPLL